MAAASASSSRPFSLPESAGDAVGVFYRDSATLPWRVLAPGEELPAEGQVKLRVGPEFDWLSDFTPAQPLRIHTLEITSTTDLKAEEIQGLAKGFLPEALRITGNALGAETAKNLLVFEQLEALDLRGTDVSPEVAHALSNHSKLSHIDFQQTGLDDEMLESIARLPRLRSLNLRGTRISNAGLVFLVAAENLESLTLPSQITDEGIETTSRNENLRALWLQDTSFTESVMKSVSELPKLELLALPSQIQLDFESSEESFPELKTLLMTAREMPETSFEKIAAMPKMHTLAIEAPPTWNDIGHLARVPNLMRLSLKSELNEPSDIWRLRELGSIEELRLRVPALSDEQSQFLDEMKSLRKLHFEASRLSALRLTQLTEALGDCRVTHHPRTLPRIGSNDPNSILLVKFREIVGNAAAHWEPLSFSGNLANIPANTEISITLEHANEFDFRELYGVRSNVVELRFLNCEFAPRQAVQLALFPGLKTLDLPGTWPPEELFEALPRIHGLLRVELSENPITNDELEGLLELPELKYLILRRCELHEDSLEVLKHFAGLAELDLRGNQLNDTRIAQLKEALPDCRIIN